MHSAFCLCEVRERNGRGEVGRRISVRKASERRGQGGSQYGERGRKNGAETARERRERNGKDGKEAEKANKSGESAGKE